jgi:hypothetical protein
MNAVHWLQDLPLSTWIRQSSWVTLGLAILHLFGATLMAGAGALIASRALGLARGIKPARFTCFVPVMRGGFALALFSGLLLTAAYPAKALNNPVFYVKLGLLVIVVLMTALLLARFGKPAEDPYAVPPGSRAIGVAILVIWIAIVACGNVLGYTRNTLLAFAGTL